MERMSVSTSAIIYNVSQIVKTKQIARPWQRLAAILRVIAGIKQALSMKRQRARFSYPYDYDDQSEDEEIFFGSPRDLKTSIPSDVSEGHLAVYAVNDEERVERFVIPVGYLKHPLFMKLLQEAEDEFGFNYRNGALTLPCDPSVLAHIIHLLTHAPLLRDRNHFLGSSIRLILQNASEYVCCGGGGWLRLARIY